MLHTLTWQYEQERTVSDLPASPRPPASFARRRFLHTTALGSLAVGTGAALGGCSRDGAALGDATAAEGPASTMSMGAGDAALGAAPSAPFQLFEDAGLNFEALFAVGGAGVNSEVGEVVTAVNQANAATGGATYQSYYDAMLATGNRLVEAAMSAEEKGHHESARSRYLRAAQYYNQALFFVLGTDTPDAEREVYETMDDAWRRAGLLMAPVWEAVDIPYEGSTLPGWFLAPRQSSGRRPTVVLNNGSDGQNVDLWAWGGAAALDRGYNVLLFDGPGQGEMLFVREVPFRPDWEAVITPVVDWLLGRNDVDRNRIGLVGWSEGGELVARAAAFEDRLAAVVTDPGSVDVYLAFPAALRQVAEGSEAAVNNAWTQGIIPGATTEQTFELKKRLEIYSSEALRQARRGKVPTDWYGLSHRIGEFQVRDVAERIRVPVLVVNYDLEQFYPGQAKELFDLLRSDRRTMVDFTVAEGAQFHCAPMAPQWRNEVLLDWLSDRFTG